jgi:hypothetical protein
MKFKPCALGGLITYHKFNEIIAMKKHVEDDHSSFMKKLVKDPTCITKAPIHQNASKKMAHVSSSEMFRFLKISSKFKKR